MKKLLLLSLFLLSKLTYAQVDVEPKKEILSNCLIKSIKPNSIPNSVICLCDNNKVYQWDYNINQIIEIPELADENIELIDVNYDLKYFVTVSRKNKVSVWELNGFKKIKTFIDNGDQISSIKFSATDNLIAFRTAGTHFYIYDIEKMKKTFSVETPNGYITDMTFSIDNKWIYTTTKKGVDTYNISKGILAEKHNTGYCLYKIFNDSYKNQLIYTGEGDIMSLFKLKNSKIFKQIANTSTVTVIIGYNGDVITVHDDGTLLIWNTFQGMFDDKHLIHEKKILDCAFVSNGSFVVTSSEDFYLKLWSMQDLNPMPVNDYPGPSGDKEMQVPIDSISIKISNIDNDIPTNTKVETNIKTFAVIIANENYTDEARVDHALNDGTIFKEYCEKTLGIPAENIHFAKNATYGKLITEKDWLANNLKAYKGDAKAIFYYAGHGIPGGEDKPAYLLPVDGTSSNVASALKLDDLYSTLTENPNKGVTVFLDACFSGSARDAGMLASARGTKLKPRESTLPGNLVVFSAASGDETAWPYKDKQHGMFTYYLLKKLQETKGDVTYKALADYINDNVYKTAIKLNNKPQTPTTKAGTEAMDWENWKLK